MYKTQEQPMGQFRIGFSFFGCGDCILFEVVDGATIRHRKFSNEYGQAYTGHDPFPVKVKKKETVNNEKHLYSWPFS